MNKDSKLLAEAYDQVEDLRGWAKAGTDSAQIASGEITRLENKVLQLTEAVNVAINVFDEILEAMEYGELPEYRQEALRKAHEMLTKSLAQPK